MLPTYKIHSFVNSRFTAVLVAFFFSFAASAQTIDCEKMKNRKTSYVRKGQVEPELNDSTRLDMKIFETCGGWDEIDKKIFAWPNILLISLDYCDIGEDETYAQILHGISLYKLTEEYRNARLAFVPKPEKKPETAQKIECEKFVNKMPTYVRKGMIRMELDDSTRLDMKIFETCGGWDEIDKKIFEWPNIVGISLDYCAIGEAESYAQILHGVSIYKSTKEYQLARDKVILEMEASAKTVIPVETETKATSSSNSKAELVVEPAQENGVFYQLNDVASAVEAGKEQQKKVLIYFTGWASVNSRKIEDRILIDKNIQTLLAENFLCFSAYTDDKMKIPGSTLTIGEKNANIQIEQFKTAGQPCFYILNERGKVVSELSYVLTVSEFETFLKKGLK